MSRWIAGLVLALALACGLSAMADSDDFVMGNYSGTATSDGGDTIGLHAQVAAMPAARWRAVIFVPDEYGDETRIEIKGRKEKVKLAEGEKENPKEIRVNFDDEADLGYDLGGVFELKGQIFHQKFTGTYEGDEDSGTFELERVVIESPTLGLEPPEGAIVLMDGKSTDAWDCRPYWQILGDGSMGMRGSSLVSKQEFGSAQYHVEFKCPFMPNDLGQARGNSGCYVMGRYEVQVLDSFADLPADNLCGGIYKKAVPLVCASAPPLQWQTYDITFTAPKYENGAKTANARITAMHNGILIHDDIELPEGTPGGVSNEEAPAGPLFFQDHGNDVNYRNVWVKPLE